MSVIALKIVTPERVVYEDRVDAVSLMTQQGEITILPNHVPLITTMRAGEMRLKKGKDETYLVASTGFVEVRTGNQVVVLADTAERAEDLQLESIQQAKDEAKRLLEEKLTAGETAYANAAEALERELARERLAIKRKRS